MPLNEEHSHRPSALQAPLSSQAFQTQRAASSSSDLSYVSHTSSTEAIGTGMAMRDSAENTPTYQSMYEYICGKIKEWYDRAFRYLTYLFTRTIDDL